MNKDTISFILPSPIMSFTKENDDEDKWNEAGVTTSKERTPISNDFVMNSYSLQTFVLLFILAFDIITVSHMITKNSGEKMFFFYGVNFYIKYPNRPWTIAHGCIGFIPLVLSLWQISSVARKKSMQAHKKIGHLLIACGVLQIPTTIYLSINWAEEEVTNVMRGLLVVFGFLWGLWGIAVLYYVKWKKDISLHQQWAVRFTVICHYVPIFGRMLAVVIWFMKGHPMDEIGRIKTLQAGIWTLVAIFFPLQEFFVWLECGTCWYSFFNAIIMKKICKDRDNKDDEKSMNDQERVN